MYKMNLPNTITQACVLGNVGFIYPTYRVREKMSTAYVAVKLQPCCIISLSFQPCFQLTT